MGMSASVAKAAQAAGPQAQVEVKLDPPHASLVRRLEQPNLDEGATTLQRAGYDWVCSGKCELVLPPGHHIFAVSIDNATAVSPSTVYLPAGRSILHGRHEQSSTALAWVLVGTSPVTWYASLMLMKAANGGDSVSGGQVALGSGLALAQLATGIVLLAKPGETATLTLVPATGAPTSSRFDIEHAVAQNQLRGLSLQIAF